MNIRNRVIDYLINRGDSVADFSMEDAKIYYEATSNKDIISEIEKIFEKASYETNIDSITELLEFASDVVIASKNTNSTAIKLERLIENYKEALSQTKREETDFTLLYDFLEFVKNTDEEDNLTKIYSLFKEDKQSRLL